MRKPSSRQLLVLALLVALVSFNITATAQSPDSARAEELFKEAREALARGAYEEACPKFAESNALKPNIGALLNLADCHEKNRALVAAAETYEQAIRLAETAKDNRREYAQERRDALMRRIPKLRVVLPDGVPPGCRVFLDGLVLGSDKIGVPQLVAPGTSHAIQVVCPGRRGEKRQDRSVVLAEGQEKSVTILSSALLNEEDPYEVGGADAGVVAPAKSTASRDRPRSSRPTPPTKQAPATDLTLAYVAGGIGAAGVVVGLVTGAMLMTNRNKITSHCDAARRCDQAGLDAVDSSKTSVPVNKAAWIVGIVGLGAGTVLFLTASPSDDGVPGMSGVTLVARGILP